jgi:prepilin-type N-terminal cleavage/methylation domain-containing protein
MRERGFSLLEMLVVVAVFTVITGAVFGLLDVAQQRYRTESEVLDAFQGARIALDQITRDVHAAGYPPLKSLSGAQQAANSDRLAYAFAWQPGYNTQPALAAPCQVPTPLLLGNCNVPGPYELILESDIDPENANGVEWIRYALGGQGDPNMPDRTTLYRGIATKVAGGDPVVATSRVMTPYVENVMNNASGADIARILASYPNVFPGGVPVPIFTYSFENKAGCPTQPPPPNLPVPAPPNCIREVSITMILQSATVDMRSRQPRVITLSGLARRINPS